MDNIKSIKKETEIIAKNIVEELRDEINIFAEKDDRGLWHFYLENNSRKDPVLSFGLSKEYKKSNRFILLNEKKKQIKKIARVKDLVNKLIRTFGNKQNLMANVFLGCANVPDDNKYISPEYRLHLIKQTLFVKFSNEFIELDDEILTELSAKGIEIYCENWDYAVENTLRKNMFSFVNIWDGSTSMLTIALNWKNTVLYSPCHEKETATTIALWKPSLAG